MVGTQNSYIQDFDVEIAQAAAIGDPIVQTIRDGIILDYKVLGGWGHAWVVEQNKAYARTLHELDRTRLRPGLEGLAEFRRRAGLPAREAHQLVSCITSS